MDREDPDSDPDHSQNLIVSSFYLVRHILKISSKSIHKFLSYLVHKQTNKIRDGETNPGENITSLAEVIIMSRDSCDVVRFDLGSLLLSAYIVLITGPRGLRCQTNL